MPVTAYNALMMTLTQKTATAQPKAFAIPSRTEGVYMTDPRVQVGDAIKVFGKGIMTVTKIKTRRASRQDPYSNQPPIDMLYVNAN